jgi:hypothetical protein
VRDSFAAVSLFFSLSLSAPSCCITDVPSDDDTADWRRTFGPETLDRSMVECESLVDSSSMSAVKSSGVLVEIWSLLELEFSISETERSSECEVRMLTEPPSTPVWTDERRSEVVTGTPRRTSVRGCCGLSSG